MIKPFTLEGNKEHGGRGEVSSSNVENHIRQTEHGNASKSDRATEKERGFSSPAGGSSSQSPSSVTSIHRSANRSRKKGIDNRQLAILSSTLGLDEEEKVRGFDGRYPGSC